MKTCPVCEKPYPDQHISCPTDGAKLIEIRELPPEHVVRGKYRILRLLGRGGMGEVYLAEHLLLGGQLALKFLSRDLCTDPQFIRRFRQEARVASQLRHPNVAEVTDLDQDEDGTLFIAMEYVAGPSLRQALLEAGGRGLAVERAVAIARGVALGLEAAHERGVVHRDVKPENILLQAGRRGEQPKVLDFGIAAMSDALTQASRTRGLLLTPGYAAPEQWRGTPAAELDGRTDLYALGVMLYEMLAGRKPYSASNNEGWMFQHLQGTPEPLSRVRPELAREAPGLETVVVHLMAREREDRPADVAAFLAELDGAGKAQVQAARMETVVESAPRGRAETVVERAPAAAPAVAVRAVEPRKPTAPAKRVESAAPRVKKKWHPALKAALVIAGIVAVGLLRTLWEMRPMTPTPTLSPAPGKYAAQHEVWVTPGGNLAEKLYYTLDGSDPGDRIRPLPMKDGRASLWVPSGSTLRVIATANGHKASAEVGGKYEWGAEVPNDLRDHPWYDQGKYFYDGKEYVAARELFQQNCEQDAPFAEESCNYLGYMLANGLGGERSVDKAREVYRKACDGRNWASCTSLGTIYEQSGDLENARKYYQKGCDGGIDKACELVKTMQ